MAVKPTWANSSSKKPQARFFKSRLSAVQHHPDIAGNLQVTWHLQMMSEIIADMNALGGTGRTFVLPLTAATQYAAVNISCMHFTTSGRSLAVQLGLRLLSTAQQEAVVLEIVGRVAKANGRTAPSELPAAFKALLEILGGSPRLLTFALEHIGGLDWRGGMPASFLPPP